MPRRPPSRPPAFVGTIRDLAVQIPDTIVDAIDRWILKVHHPIDIDGDPVCLRCKTLWPCATVTAIESRRHA